MGTCASMASRKAPGLNAPIFPSRLRVPSGKIITGIPRSRYQRALVERRPAALPVAPRFTGMSPESRK